MDLSINLELLFTESGARVTDRLRACAEAGFAHAEIWHWRNKDVGALRKTLKATAVDLVSLISEPRVDLADRDSHRQFLTGFRASCETADRLECGRVVVASGHALPSASFDEQRRTVVDVLAQAAEVAADYEVVLALENVNSRVDHPGTLLDTASACISVVREINSPQLRLLLDRYHSLVMGEQVGDLTDAGHLITHVQIADVPGRGEPGTGTVDWGRELHALTALGYRGQLGLEYRPTCDSLKSLEYIRALAAGP